MGCLICRLTRVRLTKFVSILIDFWEKLPDDYSKVNKKVEAWEYDMTKLFLIWENNIENPIFIEGSKLDWEDPTENREIKIVRINC